MEEVVLIFISPAEAEHLGFVNWHQSQETLQRLLTDREHRERAVRDVREAFRKTYGFDCECLK